MLASPAWRAISANARRLIDYLKIEHRKHAGRENGRLYATHEQLREYGMTGDCIRPAVEEAEFLGFIKAERGGRWNGTNTPSRYTLTFYATHDDQAATNDWRRVTEAQIAEYREEKRARRKGHKIRSATSRTRGTVLR